MSTNGNPLDDQLQLPNNALPQESSHTSQEIHVSSHTAEPDKCLSFVPKKRWRKSAEEFVKALAENKTSPKDDIAAKILSQESPSSVNYKKESAKRPRYFLYQLIFYLWNTCLVTTFVYVYSRTVGTLCFIF